eukprot:6160351-Amphidinium_carterae.1
MNCSWESCNSLLDSPSPPTFATDPSREISNPLLPLQYDSEVEGLASESMTTKQPSILFAAVSGTLGSVLAECALLPVDKVREAPKQLKWAKK